MVNLIVLIFWELYIINIRFYSHIFFKYDFSLSSHFSSHHNLLHRFTLWGSTQDPYTKLCYERKDQTWDIFARYSYNIHTKPPYTSHCLHPSIIELCTRFISLNLMYMLGLRAETHRPGWWCISMTKIRPDDTKQGVEECSNVSITMAHHWAMINTLCVPFTWQALWVLYCLWSLVRVYTARARLPITERLQRSLSHSPVAACGGFVRPRHVNTATAGLNTNLVSINNIQQLNKRMQTSQTIEKVISYGEIELWIRCARHLLSDSSSATCEFVFFDTKTAPKRNQLGRTMLW